jgi:transposase InsO family protein
MDAPAEGLPSAQANLRQSVVTSGVPPIPKLDGRTNYASWSFGMKMFLIDCGLWNCVECPEELERERSDARRLDEQARAKICLSISPRIYSTVKSTKTAKDAWNKLKSQYADKGLNRRLTLLRQLFNEKLTSHGNMDTYVNSIRDIQEKLNEIEAGLEDEFIGVIMLAGLTENFKPLIMALEHSGAKITSDSVATRLLSEDYKSTPEEPSPSTSFSASTSKLQCKFCKKFGHVISNCRKRKQNKTPPKDNKTNFITDITLSTSFNSCPSGAQLKQDWLLDSGATSHMCNDRNFLQNFTSSTSKPIYVANNDQIPSDGSGTAVLPLSNGDTCTLSNVLHVPNIASNLLSVSNLVREGHVIVFSQRGATVLRRENCKVSGQVVATASNYKNLYKLDLANIANLTNQCLPTALLWHRRLGHLNVKAVNILKNRQIGVTFSDKLAKTCVPCIQGKLTKRPFTPSKRETSCKLEVIHSDLCGPMSTHSFGGALYLLTFTDNFSRKTFGYLLKSKSEVFMKFIDFKNLVENQTGLKIKALRSDGGGEYVNQQMSNFLKVNGIIHQISIPYNPQQNGLSERVNRTVVEKARTMLQDAGMSRAYWGEAVSTAIYLKNHSPTTALNNKIPEEVWTGKKVNLAHLRVFGCRAHVLIPKEKRTKLDPKTETCVFVGYSEQHKGYRLINPRNPRRVIIARDVVFVENNPTAVTCSQPTIENLPNSPSSSTQPYVIDVSHPSTLSSSSSSPISTSLPPVTEQPDFGETVPTNELEPEPEVFTDVESEPPPDPECERRYPSRERRPPIRFPENDCSSLCMISCDSEPETYKEAIQNSNRDKWLKAMETEYNCLMKNGTWKIVDRPEDRTIVKNKWVFKVKKDTDGKVVKYKARLVAKGFTQIHGVDYGETYSPVARLSSIRLLLALAAKLNLKVDHLDVETAFLNGDLEEEIFMEQPEGYAPEGKRKVCLLQKSLYGLKQAPRQWNLKVREAMESLSMTQLETEHCIYFKRSNDNLIIVAIFVDDFFIFSNSDVIKNDFKTELKKKFIIKDLGTLKDCLGMRVSQTDGAITLDQTNYIEKLISKFGMSDAISVSTPLEPGVKLMLPNKEDERPDLPYQQLIGSLMYIAIGTRPDIAHAVSVLSQFNTHYGEVHWRAGKRVIRYLKATKLLKLKYQSDTTSKTRELCFDVSGYADADYGSCLVDRRSYTGYVFMLSGGPISWESRKQRTVALSTTEAEYMSLGEACKEAIYLRAIINKLMNTTTLLNLYCDNQSSLKLAHSNTYHSRSKHIDIRHHFIRTCLNEIHLKYMPTSKMKADVLTKCLCKLKHQQSVLYLGLT